MKQKDDEEALKADVAQYAANLGLAPSQTGFNDSDFRKKGPLQKPKPNPVSQNPRKQAAGDKPGKSNNKSAANAPKRNDRKRPRDENAGPEPAPETQKPEALTPDELSSAKAIKFSKDVCHSFAKWGEGGEKWYQVSGKLSSSVKLVEAGNNEDVQGKRSQAALLLKMVSVEFNKKRKNDSEMRMILSARRSGTSADKVAAMTVLIQDNPVANLQILDSLLGMVTSKGGKRHAVSGLDVLKELFITSLLPDRKLKHFESQPLAKLPETKEGLSLLLWWYWEDCIKDRYQKYVKAVMEGSRDSLVHLKLKSIKTLYELLCHKPEQEKELLSAIVNKLGDPEKKAASNASYLLAGVLIKHPSMKKVVLREVELFIFRPNLGLRAVYYACVFMNRVFLSTAGDGPMIAKQLVDIYFGVFKAIIFKTKSGKLGEDENEANNKEKLAAVDSRLLSSLLTGVNRAFRFVSEDNVDAIIEDHTPTLFRLVHSSNFNVGIQALLLIHQLLSKHEAVSDRFYRALYSVLLSPALPKSSKVDMCLALVFKVLKSDVSTKRICALMKRLLQVVQHQSPELCCACLLLMSEVLKEKPLLWNFIVEPATEDDESEHFKDVELREVEPASGSEPAAPSEDVDSDSDFQVEDDMAENFGGDEFSDDEDHQVRRKKKNSKKNSRKQSITEAPATPKAGTLAKDSEKSRSSYDPRHRDPLYCKADQTCWWELSVLASHIHPSVSAMAKALLSNSHVVYSGDPIHDLAFSAFLDRFAEKKPKPPKKTGEGDEGLKREVNSNIPVGMELASLAEDDVAPADLIFHRFYSTKAASKKGRRKKKDLDDADVEDMLGSGGEEEDEVGDGDDDEQEPELEEPELEEPDEEPEVEEDEREVDEDSQGDDSENEEVQRLLDAGMDFSDDDEVELDDSGGDDDEEFEFEEGLTPVEGFDSRKKLKKVESSPGKNRKMKTEKRKKMKMEVEEPGDESLEDEEEPEKKRRGGGVARKRRAGAGGVGVASKKSSFASAEDYKHLLD